VKLVRNLIITKDEFQAGVTGYPEEYTVQELLKMVCQCPLNQRSVALLAILSVIVTIVWFGASGLRQFVGELCNRPAKAAVELTMSYEQLYIASRLVLGYETPLGTPTVQDAVAKKFRLSFPSLISWRLEQQRNLWREIIRHGFVTASHKELLQDSLRMFPDLDRTALFCLVRLLKPKRVVEIGSGESTFVAKAALEENANNPPGGPKCEHTVIEPYRASSVPKGPTIIQQEMQELGFELYDALESSDILFIDSSHVIAPYGDTLTELLIILPRLNPGVLVHIHDIFLPDDYPRGWGLKNMIYTEQWAVALMLYGAESEWEVVFSCYMMSSRYPKDILEMPHYPLRDSSTYPKGGSLWIRKLGKSRRP
jgi:hypothetical protein